MALLCRNAAPHATIRPLIAGREAVAKKLPVIHVPPTRIPLALANSNEPLHFLNILMQLSKQQSECATGWSILYRGLLSSCNYACGYCPFAKTSNTVAQLRDDQECLLRFLNWVRGRPEQISLLFTPWGEALIHGYYQRALCELSQFPNVRRVAIQTNLSCRLDWLSDANAISLALWCTFHPGETNIDAFLSQCRRLDQFDLRYSVGLVGTKENLQHLRALRDKLPPHVYIWINAFKREPGYYTQSEIQFICAMDPWFPLNNRYHTSLNRPCRTGLSAFTVDGHGDMRRCHFVKTVLANIYEPGFESALKPRPCSTATCGCHIGYIHLEELGLDKIFGNGLLERIPENHLAFTLVK